MNPQDLPTGEAVEFHRQLGIFNPYTDGQVPLTLIGAGGIGSPTALALAKMGFPDLTIYDADTVEPHNLPNQLYPLAALGQSKAISLAEECFRFSGTRPNAIPDMFEGQAELEGIVISGVDSMEARRIIWSYVRHRPNIRGYVEARMGGQVGIVHVVNPTDERSIAAYEQTLYTDAEAAEEPCTERAIAFNVFALAGLISAQVKKVAKGEEYQARITVDLVNMILLS
jgi:molybdopterin/thiamine biosynthesis adenylyltransferase